ncbi:hypothetical protein J2X65_001598 [Ancylobacter sp. 3268]|nr:hypothetical protein [Ancylobacter sp. 3268]
MVHHIRAGGTGTTEIESGRVPAGVRGHIQ